MTPQVLDPANYTFSLYAVPTFITTVAIFLLGITILARERSSQVSISFFVVTLTVSLWLFAYSWMYSTTNEAVAVWWSRFAYLGVPFIAPATYQFTVVMLRLGNGYRRLAWAGWITAAFFSVCAVCTDALLGEMHSYPWGFYPSYNWMGIPFLVFFFGLLIMSMVNYQIEYKKVPQGIDKLRIKWLVTAFGIGYVGSIDYVAVFGIPLYPCGYFAILGFLVVVTRTIGRYHLVNLTPAFAANQIVETMTNALIVLDQEGVVRVVNHAAAELFGCDGDGMSGKRLAESLPDREFSHKLAALISSGMVQNHELDYHLRSGEVRALSISTSTMEDKPGRQVAVLCIAHDITERKHAQDLIEGQLQQMAALRNIDMAITSGHDLRTNLGIILDHVLSQLHVDAADFLLLNPHSQCLEYAEGKGFRSEEITASRLRLGEGYAGRAALERRTIHVSDLSSGLGLSGGPHNAFLVRHLLPAEGMIAYYALPLLAKGQVKGVLEIFHRSHFDALPEWVDFAEALAGQAAIAIDNANLFDELQRSNMELIFAYDTTLEGWSQALDLRDKETEGHTQRVTAITERLARAMGQSDYDLVHTRRGALLHDIGKMGIPDSILLKPGPLSEEEWKIMRLHPVYAYELLSPISFLRSALDIPYCHHEKWDGTGYPRGLKGEQIPVSARIFAVVDVWDALRSDRPYRKAWSKDRVREHIHSLAGTHFDPRVVEAFLKDESALTYHSVRPLDLAFNTGSLLVGQETSAPKVLS